MTSSGKLFARSCPKVLIVNSGVVRWWWRGGGWRCDKNKFYGAREGDVTIEILTHERNTGISLHLCYIRVLKFPFLLDLTHISPCLSQYPTNIYSRPPLPPFHSVENFHMPKITSLCHSLPPASLKFLLRSHSCSVFEEYFGSPKIYPSISSGHLWPV